MVCEKNERFPGDGAHPADRPEIPRENPLRSRRQSGGAHLVHEFLRTARVQVAPQQAADLGRLGVELLDQAGQGIAVARQLWLQFVEFAGENCLDDAGGDGQPARAWQSAQTTLGNILDRRGLKPKARKAAKPKPIDIAPAAQLPTADRLGERFEACRAPEGRPTCDPLDPHRRRDFGRRPPSPTDRGSAPSQSSGPRTARRREGRCGSFAAGCRRRGRSGRSRRELDPGGTVASPSTRNCRRGDGPARPRGRPRAPSVRAARRPLSRDRARPDAPRSSLRRPSSSGSSPDRSGRRRRWPAGPRSGSRAGRRTVRSSEPPWFAARRREIPRQ